MRLNNENISVTRSSRKQCIHAAEDIKSAYHNGRWCKEKKVAELTLDKLMDNYIESRKKVLSPSTIGGYMVIKRNRFKKYMDKKPSQIDNWQKVIDDEVKAGIKSKTIRNSWSLLESSLEYAKLPVPTVALPALIKSTRPWLDADQIKTFVKAMEGNEYEVPALFALHSLRRSEIFGLTWDKIDLKNNLIRVEGSIVSDENSKQVFKETKQVFKETNKTKNSRRIIFGKRSMKSAKPMIFLLSVSTVSGTVLPVLPITSVSRSRKLCSSAAGKIPEPCTESMNISLPPTV